MAQQQSRKRQSAAALTTRMARPGREPRKLFQREAPAETNEHILAMKAYSGPKGSDDAFIKTMSFSASELSLIPTPYNLNSLVKLPKQSDILGQCIAAMVTNVVGHGWALSYIGPDGEEDGAAAKAEKQSLENLLNHPNEEQTLDELNERVKTDKETMGVGYYEVIRDQANRVTMLSHLPGHTIRMTEREVDAVEVEVSLMRDGKHVKQKVWRRFRRFVQSIGVRTVYFKEFGDPRKINPKTGKVDDTVSVEDAATEVLMDAIYAPGEVYGLPRWLGQLPGVIGNRETDLTNLDFFKNNAVPALAVLVSGGMLGSTSMENIQDSLTEVRGRDAQNRVVFIEAFSDPQAAGADGTLPLPKLELKPLAGERQKDALFLEYKVDNKKGVRSSFRLPAIFTGDSEDYTYATAKTSFEVAESQIFGPERAKTEAMFDKRILASFEAVYWSFKLQPARISDPQEVIQALTAFDNMGAMTPNLAIMMANSYFDLEIPKVDAEWGDWPFAIVKDLATKGQLIGIDEIGDIPEVPDVLDTAVDPADPKAPAPTATGEGGKPKPKGKVKPKPEEDLEKAKTKAMRMVRRHLMDLRGLAHAVKDAA